LARLRFLSILSANLDEFFMVRVGTLKRAAARGGGPVEAGAGSLAADEELHAIAIRVRVLLERQARCFTDVCLPALAAHGVRILRWSDLAAVQQEVLRRYFREEIFPFITPEAMTRAPRCGWRSPPRCRRRSESCSCASCSSRKQPRAVLPARRICTPRVASSTSVPCASSRACHSPTWTTRRIAVVCRSRRAGRSSRR